MMSASRISSLSGLACKPLTGCLAAALAAAAPGTCANSIPVTRCDDKGFVGDVRHAVAAAVTDGDIVNMSALVCPSSRISLQMGELATSHNITLLGPGRDKLVITGKYYSASGTTIQHYRILRHSGSGTITISNLSLADGYLVGSGAAPQVGGCVYSSGSVTLDHAAVFLCTAYVTSSGAAFGGGILTANGLNLSYSLVTGNFAKTGNNNTTVAVGGGAVVLGDLSADHSSIIGNSASGAAASYAGGLYVADNVTITNSTISGNTAPRFGGIFMKTALGGSALITNSTISGNMATSATVGGIFTGKSTTTIRSSTIVFNTAKTGSSGLYAPGLAAIVPGFNSAATLELQSTLIANNTYGPSVENDLSTISGAGTLTVSGANDLVRFSTASLPGGTITNVCPLLGPLRDNGGPTQTHALLSHSRGINEGNDTVGPYDQRGSPYARVSETVADIGAYEVQHDEIVFDAGFDGCPP